MSVGFDRFSVYITTTVDLACGRRKCMAEGHDEVASIGGSVLSGPWRYIKLRTL